MAGEEKDETEIGDRREMCLVWRGVRRGLCGGGLLQLFRTER